jgi:hypothetical protein
MGKATCQSLEALLEKKMSDIETVRTDGMSSNPNERALRRLLALSVGIPGLYLDDGEASGQEHGISIDFMREPIEDIDAKLRLLNIARYNASLKLQ